MALLFHKKGRHFLLAQKVGTDIPFKIKLYVLLAKLY